MRSVWIWQMLSSVPPDAAAALVASGSGRWMDELPCGVVTVLAILTIAGFIVGIRRVIQERRETSEYFKKQKGGR